MSERKEVFAVEDSGVAHVGVKGRYERRTIPHDTTPCMTMTVNTTFMRLRTTKPALQV